MAVLAAVAAAAQVAGTLMARKNAEAIGSAQNKESKFEAAQYGQQAKQEVAVAQRNAQEEQRRARVLASRALAVSAASGGGASDPTVVRMIADINGEGAYRSAAALYQGEENARRLNLAATSKLYEGKLAKAGGEAKASGIALQGIGSLAESGSSLYTKYGQRYDTNNEGGWKFA